jgi:transcriptional regulator with XRE-family HTH domain
MVTKERASDHLGKAIGACMKELRAKKGMTQGDIVRATGLERSYVSSLETGKIRHPRIQTVNKIAGAFGMKLSAFIEYCEKKHLSFLSSHAR